MLWQNHFEHLLRLRHRPRRRGLAARGRLDDSKESRAGCPAPDPAIATLLMNSDEALVL
jgi:hypothetical protein